MSRGRRTYGATMRRRSKDEIIEIYAVLVDGEPSLLEPGLKGMGDRVVRFGTREEAEAFVKGKTHWGRPATVSVEHVNKQLAKRWGLL